MTVISVLTNNRFRKCNALQAVTGLFLHSCNTSEKVIKVLSHMGISISLSSIHRAIHSLSRATRIAIQRHGRSLLISYAYDNFDVKLKVGIPTAGGLNDLMLHLTSGLMLLLNHGVTLDHLRVSGSLWDMNPNNDYATNKKEFDALKTLKFLMTLHIPQPTLSVSSQPTLTRRGEFRAWLFLQTLIAHGPAYFANMKASVGEPSAVEMIPICKTEQMPFRAMDLNQSRVAGNIDAIMDMLGQAGVGSHGANVSGLEEVDISPYVQLVHGDLGTMERVLSAMERRAIDMTPEDRLQFIVFVFGLFHFKMAAADAIWRILVTPANARKDSASFWDIVRRLRPKMANHLVNNATFREQHDLINHVGSILRLDAWRVEAKKIGYPTLQAWAESQPPFIEVVRMSERIVGRCVEGGYDVSMFQLQTKPAAQQDKLHQNTMRTHHYLLLYEELSYGMNAGDIGRVETLFQPWVYVFKATGKHKYASRMLQFMHQLYDVYPPGLR